MRLVAKIHEEGCGLEAALLAWKGAPWPPHCVSPRPTRVLPLSGLLHASCSVRMSALALLKIAMHARSGGNLEVRTARVGPLTRGRVGWGRVG